MLHLMFCLFLISARQSIEVLILSIYCKICILTFNGRKNTGKIKTNDLVYSAPTKVKKTRALSSTF